VSIEDQIAAIAAAGLRLNNLFELRDRTWQANVCRGTECFEYGVGATPSEALADALSKVSEMTLRKKGGIFE
jgi:hypothetical protein